MRKPPTTRESATLEMLQKRIDPNGIRLERMRMEEGWIKNMAYFSGQQYFYIADGRVWDASGDIPEHKVLYQINLIRSAVIRATAKICNIHSRFKAVPKTPSIKHRNIAETSEKFFDHLRRINEWDYRLHALCTEWAAICGSGFYRIAFDPLAGEPDRFYLDSAQTKNVVPEAMLSDADIREKERDGLFQDFASGDVRITVENPFAVHHDWTSRDRSIDGCQWIGFKHYLDRSVLGDRYKIDPKDIQPSEGGPGLANYEEAIAFFGQSMGGSPMNWYTPEDKRGERALHVEMWQRPSREYPRGRRVVSVGGRVAVDGDNPHVGDRSAASHLPVVKQDWTMHPGRFWGNSLVEDLTSPQNNLNESRSCLLEYLRCFGRPATFVYSDSGIDIKNQTIDPGGVYSINPNSKGVVHGPIPQLPAEVTNIGQLCQQDLLAVASQSEVDGTKLPGQMRSGAAIQEMTQVRDLALTASAIEAVRATRDVGRIALGLAKLFYTEKRTVQVLGIDGQFEWMDFSGADLTNDLIIVGEPGQMETSAGKRQEMMDAIQIGAVNPAENPEDRELVLASMHFNDDGILINSKLKARKNQEYEIQEMIKNTAKYVPGGYPVADYEDHATEAAVLRDYLYSPDCRLLDKVTKSLLAQHLALHERELQKKQMAALQMQAMTQGSPGTKGRASQPAA